MKVRLEIIDDVGNNWEGEIELTNNKLEGTPKKVKVSSQKKSNRKSKVTIPDRILELKDDSFFNTPKLSKEVEGELKICGYYYNSKPIMKALLDLVKRKDLRRIKHKNENGKEVFKYVNP